MPLAIGELGVVMGRRRWGGAVGRLGNVQGRWGGRKVVRVYT